LTTTIPTLATAGNHTITVTDGTTTTATTVTVTASGTSGGSSGLPVTGSSNSLPLSQAGAALEAAGALVVLGVRRPAAKQDSTDVLV